MGLFDGIDSTKPTRTTEYIKPGKYIAIIDGVKEGTSRKNDDFVVFNMTVLETLQQATDEETGEVLSHCAGDEITDMYMAKYDTFLPNIKAAVMAIFGCEESEVDAETCSKMTSNEQPMAGIAVSVTAKDIVTKKGTTFTKVKYNGAAHRTELSKATKIPEGTLFHDDLKK